MKYVGILFNRENLDTGVYLYKPVYLVEGTLEEQELGVRFYDEIGNEYSLMNDPNTMLFEDNQVVGYLMPKTEFEKKGKYTSIEDTKSMYFDEMRSYAYIGFYVPNKDKIIITNFSLTNIMESIEKMDSDKVIIAPELMKNGEEEKDVELEFSPRHFYDKLINFYHSSYYALKNTKTVEELKEGLELTHRGFFSFCDFIEKQNIEEYQKEFVINKIFTYMDGLDELDGKSFEDVKRELLTLYTSHNDDFLKLENVLMPKVEKEYEGAFIEPKKDTDKPNVREMKKFFDAKIIGQEEAKKDVIAAIIMNKYSKNASDKNNCLLVGPTGSGKTLIAETVSEYFDMPIEIIDTTQLTMPGYVGANIEDFLARLIAKADGDIEKAEHGIVVFDEIDKKGSESNGDVSGKGVLNTLLPFLQGTTYDVKYNGRVVHFNTKDVTIFATGAFTDVAEAKGSKRHRTNTIGFTANIEDKKEEDIKYEKLEIEDFVKHGNMPIEIMGRFSVIAQLDGHTKESLKRILIESNVSPLLGEQGKLSNLGIALDYEDEYLDAVVEEAFKLKTGARSLKSIVEKSVKEARWEVLENLDIYNRILLNSNSVLDNLDVNLGEIEGTLVNLKDLRKVKVKKKEG